MADNNAQEPMNQNAKSSHNKKKMIITASILIAAVPGAAIALHSSTSDGSSSSDISIHSSTSPADTITTEVPSPDVFSTTPTGSATSGDKSNTNSVSVTVNGQDITVPENGSTSQTVPGPDGNTSVNITHTGSSSNTTNVSTQITTQNSNDSTGGYSSSFNSVNMFSSH